MSEANGPGSTRGQVETGVPVPPQGTGHSAAHSGAWSVGYVFSGYCSQPKKLLCPGLHSRIGVGVWLCQALKPSQFTCMVTALRVHPRSGSSCGISCSFVCNQITVQGPHCPILLPSIPLPPSGHVVPRSTHCSVNLHSALRLSQRMEQGSKVGGVSSPPRPAWISL